MSRPDDMPCSAIVERVTAYLEGAMDEDERTRFELHVVACGGCEAYLEQMRTTVRALRVLPEETPEPAVDALLDAFRTWRAQ